jgi:hypothetical protein
MSVERKCGTKLVYETLMTCPLAFFALQIAFEEILIIQRKVIWIRLSVDLSNLVDLLSRSCRLCLINSLSAQLVESRYERNPERLVKGFYLCTKSSFQNVAVSLWQRFVLDKPEKKQLGVNFNWHMLMKWTVHRCSRCESIIRST